MRKLILPLTLLLSAYSFAQEVTKLTAGMHNQFGISYSLPKSVIYVELEAIKTVEKSGPYYRYADKYLGVQNIITENNTNWKLNNIKLIPGAVADKDNSYIVTYKSGYSPSFYINEDGILCSINMEPSFDTRTNFDNNKQVRKSNTGGIDMSVLSEEQLTAGSTAKMAEVAAKQIYRIRESRMNLITGEMDQLPADGESYKLAMSEMKKNEDALTQLFTGSAKSDTIRQIIAFIPSDKESDKILCRFSKYLGVVDSENLAGEPVYISLDITDDLRPAPEVEDPKKKKSKDKQESGVAYIMPGKANISVIYGDRKSVV